MDTNEGVLQIAHARAQAAGLSHVSFLVGHIDELALTQRFDAIVGRLILMYLREPEAVLRQLATHLRPGGVLAFQEHDIPSQGDATFPASPLWKQAVDWCTQAFQQVGVESRMGMKLCGTFLAAGLPVPQLRYEAAIGAGPEWAGYEVLAGVVRDLLPLLQKFGIATTEDIRIETLAVRLREEVASAGGVARLPALVSAWTRIKEDTMSNYLFENAWQLAGQRLSNLETADGEIDQVLASLDDPGFACSTPVLFTTWGRRP